MVTEKQIEAAARAAFDVWWNDRGAGAEYSWLCTKANWIKQQRAALLALPPEVEAARAQLRERAVLKGDAAGAVDRYGCRRHVARRALLLRSAVFVKARLRAGITPRRERPVGMGKSQAAETQAARIVFRRRRRGEVNR